jgi:hypothetical protein
VSARKVRRFRSDDFTSGPPVGHELGGAFLTTFESWKAINGNWDTAADWDGDVVPDDNIAVSLGAFATPYTVVSSAANATYGMNISSSATLDINAGVFTDRAYFSNAGTVKIQQGAEYDAGFLGAGQGYGNSGTIIMNRGTFRILDSFLSLNNGGKFLLSDSAANLITGGASKHPTTFYNARQMIAGAGSIAGAYLQFVNGAHGVVDATQALPLILNTGSEVNNAGLIESTNSGGLRIVGNINDEGELLAWEGLLQVTGGVDGYGALNIAGKGQLEIGAYANPDIEFESGSTGTLILDHGSRNYFNEIYGVAAGVHLDLRDVLDNAAVKPRFTVGGSLDEYTLSVTDGTHTVSLNLAGGANTYGPKSFQLGVDGHGGTLVTAV